MGFTYTYWGSRLVLKCNYCECYCTTQAVLASPLMQAVQSAVCINLLDSKTDAVLAAGLRNHDHIHIGVAHRAEDGAGCPWDSHHPRALQKEAGWGPADDMTCQFCGGEDVGRTFSLEFCKLCL